MKIFHGQVFIVLYLLKWYVSRDVAAKEVIIRNGKELFDYCEKILIIMEDKLNGKVMNQVFIYISAMETKDY